MDLSEKDVAFFTQELRGMNVGADQDGSLMRFKFYLKKNKTFVCTGTVTNAACTGVIQRRKEFWRDDSVVLVSYNKETPKDRGSGGTTGIGRSAHFQGGDLSMAWLKFMLDPKESIWRDVIPFIANPTDFEEINSQGGFILHSLDKCPAEPLFSFLMATRYAQENNRRCVVWKEVLDLGHDPLFAFLCSYCFQKSGEGYAPATAPVHSFQTQPSALWAKNLMTRSFRPYVLCGDKGRYDSPWGLKGRLGADQWWFDLDKVHKLSFKERFIPLPPTATLEEMIKAIQAFLDKPEVKEVEIEAKPDNREFFINGFGDKVYYLQGAAR